MKKVTMFVSSCDKNEDLWPVFFEILKRQWPESVNMKIVMNTESKEYEYEGYNIECPCVCREQDRMDMSWSDRCKAALRHVKTEYCLFVLDDFFLAKSVDHALFEQMIAEIKNEKKFGCVYFCAMRNLYPNRRIEGKTYLKSVNKYSDYKAQLVPALWKTDLLQRLMPSGKNIWEAELCMRNSSYRMGGRFEYYSLKEYELDRTPYYLRKVPREWVLCYDFRMQLVKGKWVNSLMGYIEELGLEHNVQFSDRGCINHDFDRDAEKYIDERIELLSYGERSYTRYLYLHNFIIPQLSRIKWRIIDVYRGLQIRK